jgi:hypothetical protein
VNYTSVTAVEIEGVVHEFSRLPGVREPILSLLFRFRKINFNAPFLALKEISVVPFFFYGPGVFSAKNILLPPGIEYQNPDLSIGTLSCSAFVRGRLLVQKHYAWSSFPGIGEPLCVTRSWFSGVGYFSYPWMSLGTPIGPIERVGFRIDLIGPLRRKNEILIFEIVTTGGMSPRKALKEAALLLVQKFSVIGHAVLPLPCGNSFSRTRRARRVGFYSSFPCFSDNYHQAANSKLSLEASRLSSYDLCDSEFSLLFDPLGLDLGNLDLSKKRFSDLRNLGFRTLGQLLERLSLEPSSFSPSLKRQIQLAFFNLGFFPFFH